MVKSRSQIEKEIKTEKAWAKVYYTYRIIKFLIFLLNLFVIYSYIIKEEPKLLLLSLILNIIYSLIYIRRILIIIVSIIVCYMLYNNVYHSICIGLAIGNGISYLIDFIRIVIFSLIIRILEWSSRK